jgi:hypothetical protein
MKSVLCAIVLALFFSSSSAAGQESATLPARDVPPALQSDGPVKPETSPKSTGGTTLIGCLSGPDADGNFILRSMSHRSGVEVFGPEALKDDSGSKVKLTGSWKPSDQPAATGKQSRKFQATDIEVLAPQCEAPSEKTPVSKEKQQRQQQKQKAGASADTASPK